MKICLDAGHTKGSNTVSGYSEGTSMFTLSLLLKAEFEKYRDVSVFLTRLAVGDNPSLEERGKFARDHACDLFISLHTNAAGDPTANGTEVIYSVKRDSSRFATALGQVIADVMKPDTGCTRFRRAYTRLYPETASLDYYGVIRSAVKSAAIKHALIVEHGFHTNSAERRWLSKKENLQKLAEAHADAIAKQFGLVMQTVIPLPEKPVSPPASTLYTVKKGDTLIGIARRYDTTYQQLAEYNHLANPSVIRVGQKIVIPCAVSAADKPSSQPAVPDLAVGNTVRLKKGVTKFYDGTPILSCLRGAVFYIRELQVKNGIRVYLISTEPTKNVYTGRVKRTDVQKA